MKAAELILAVAALACGLLSAALSYAKCPRLSGVTGGLAVVLCAVWLLLRTL